MFVLWSSLIYMLQLIILHISNSDSSCAVTAIIYHISGRNLSIVLHIGFPLDEYYVVED